MAQTVTVYHGSQHIISEPALGKGNPRNDYGLGFYCTYSIELAKEWACTEEGSGYANQYILDLTSLTVMNLSGPDYNILNWLAVLLDNRIFRISNDVAAAGKDYLLERFLPRTSSFDIITGYRADDSYFSFANAFLNNTLSLAQLEKSMYLGKLGEQIVLKSGKAFGQIIYSGYHPADGNIYYPMKVSRDLQARADFRKELSIARVEDSIYLMDILRGRWGNDDVRIRRNLP